MKIIHNVIIKHGSKGQPGYLKLHPSSKNAARVQRAIESYIPQSKSIRARSTLNERRVAKAIRGMHHGGKSPMDVQKGNNWVEVKSIFRGKNDKLTMHSGKGIDSLGRKKEFVREKRGQAHTVGIDERTKPMGVYYKKGLGSFRLKNMIKLPDLKALNKYIQ